MRDDAPPRPDPLAPLVEALHEEGRPRVWSLVVTVFGDAVAPRGGRVGTAALAALLGRVGVGEGALRTALSRLVADGTLERDRRGRASFHRLSAQAAAEVERASRIIYAPPLSGEGAAKAWVMGTGPAPARALEIGAGAWLAREPGDREPGDLGAAVAVRGTLLSARGIEPAPAHAAALERLSRDLAALEAALGLADGEGPHARDAGGTTAQAPAARRSGAGEGQAGKARAGEGGLSEGADDQRRRRGGAGRGAGGGAREGPGQAPSPIAAAGRRASGRAASASPAGLAPLDAMAARTLLVHRWRRIALRWPDLPPPDPLPGADARPHDLARARVARAYGALLAPSEIWLDEAALGEAPRSPPVAQRFR